MIGVRSLAMERNKIDLTDFVVNICSLSVAENEDGEEEEEEDQLYLHRENFRQMLMDPR